MSHLVLVDTSVWLFALGDRPIAEIRDQVQSLVENNLAATNVAIMYELLSFTMAAGQRTQLTDYLSALHLFPLSHRDWMAAALWMATLRSKDIKLKSMDALIAYTALQNDATLLHADSDFDKFCPAAEVRSQSCVTLAQKYSKKKR